MGQPCVHGSGQPANSVARDAVGVLPRDARGESADERGGSGANAAAHAADELDRLRAERHLRY